MISTPPEHNSDSTPNDIPAFLRESLSLGPQDVIIVCQLICRIVVAVDNQRLPDVERQRDTSSEIANRLRDWDLVITTHGDLEWRIERSILQFNKLETVSSELSEKIVGEGLFTGSDLAALGAERLAQEFGVEQAVAARMIKDALSYDNPSGGDHTRWG